MAARFLGVAAALLLVPASGLAAQSFLGMGVVEDDLSPDPAAAELSQANRAWLDKAAKASEEMDEELKTVMSDIASTARKEADPRTRKEQQLQMLEDVLKEYDTDNETSIDETSRRMAAIAFRKAIRNHIRRPHRKTAKAAEEAVDPKLAEELSAWVHEANRASHDLEKEASTEESDLGLEKPKGEEEKTLDRVADLIDEVDPKNASEMANLGDALAQERRPKLLHPRASRRASHQEPTGEDAKMVEAMREWVLEANKASQDLEKDARHEESDLGDAKPKGEEEQNLERVADLIDEVDPKNASEMADLADKLAQVQRWPKRKAARQASQDMSEADSKVVEAIKTWMAEASKASHELEREARHEESDLGDAKGKGEEEKTLERVADLIDEVDPKNASEMADLADKLAQVQRWPKRKAARKSHHITSVSDADSKMVEAMRSWMSEAVKASDDLEREARHEESDLGDAKAKGEEEKTLERVADLIDEVDPKNASEMADLADKLAQVQRWPKRKRQASQDMSEAGSTIVEAMKVWIAEANKASQDLEREARHEESDLGDAKGKGEEEKTLERVADLIDEVDPKNASEMADLADKLAQVQRRPKRKAARQASQDISDTDAKVVEAMKNWMAEAAKASQELEKDVRREESDLGDAKPKGEEERNLDRVADLIDEVDPKNASEMADLADELHQKARTLGGELKPRAEPAGEAAQERRSARPVLPTFAPYGSEEEAARVWRERLNGSAEAADAMKSWMAEADQANNAIDKEIDMAIDELAQEVPKSDEEKDLDRVMHLIDGTNPENASEVADLAASLARSSSFARRVGKVPAAWSANQTAWDWTQEDAKRFWSWLKDAEEASNTLDQDLDAAEAQFREYLKGMTSKQEGAMHRQLKVLEEMWEKYGFENESATAEDVLEKLDDAPAYTAA